MATAEQPHLASDIEVMTLSEAAAFLRVDEDAVLRTVHEQGLPGRQIGSQWRFSRRAILQWLLGPTAKQQILAMAGAFKDDPYLADITNEIFEARGRSMTEE